MEKLIATFDCVDDAGNRYTVHEYQEFIDATHMQSKGQEWVPGLKRGVLSDGTPLAGAGREPGSFRLLDGTIIRRV